MRTIDWKSLAVAIAAAAIGFWILQPAASDPIAARVARLAARMHGVTPRPMADGSTLRSVTADGRTILLAIDGATPWRPISTDAAMTALRAADLCGRDDLRALIGAGAQVRIEGRTAAGEPLPALVIDRCDPLE